MNLIFESVILEKQRRYNIRNQGISFCIREINTQWVDYYIFLTAKHCVSHYDNLGSIIKYSYGNGFYEDVFSCLQSEDQVHPLKICVEYKLPKIDNRKPFRELPVSLIIHHPILDVSALILQKEPYSKLKQNIENKIEVYHPIVPPKSGHFIIKGADHTWLNAHSINLKYAQKPGRLSFNDRRYYISGEFPSGWSGSPIVANNTHNVIGLLSRSDKLHYGVVAPFYTINSWVEEIQNIVSKNLATIRLDGKFFSKTFIDNIRITKTDY